MQFLAAVRITHRQLKKYSFLIGQRKFDISARKLVQLQCTFSVELKNEK